MAATADALIDLAKVRELARTGRAKTIRVRAGVSLNETAEVVGVSASTVFRWEAGERAPRGEVAIRYGELLRRLGKMR